MRTTIAFLAILLNIGFLFCASLVLGIGLASLGEALPLLVQGVIVCLIVLSAANLNMVAGAPWSAREGRHKAVLWGLNACVLGGFLAISYPSVAASTVAIAWWVASALILSSPFLTSSLALFVCKPNFDGSRQCQACGYECHAGRGDRCSECGEVIASSN